MKNGFLLTAMVGLGVVWTSIGRVEARANDVWMLVVGRSHSKCWWSVVELRVPEDHESGLYEGGATLSKVLLGVFGSVPLFIDPDKIKVREDSSVRIVSADGLSTILERLVFGLIEAKDVRFRLGFPLEEARSCAADVFVPGPISITLSSEPVDREFWKQFAHGLSNNRSRILGEPSEVGRQTLDDMNQVAEFWEKVLLEGVPDISVSYSKSLDTFMFSFPKASQDKFVETCEAILSGNR
jgi:hypothetical protein